MIVYYYTGGKGIANDAEEADLGSIHNPTLCFTGLGDSYISTSVCINDACVVNTYKDTNFHLLMLLKYSPKWCKLSRLEYQSLVLSGRVRFTQARTGQIEAEILNS